MSWQDDPVVDSSSQGSDWQNDPVVEEPKSDSFASKAGSFLANTGKSLADPLNLMESAKAGSFEPTKNKLQGDYESIKPGLIGAANNFPLAPQAIAGLSPGNYSQNLEDWNQKAAEAKKESPITYGAGSVAGTLAPMAIPGVGAALSKAPVIGNALLGGANALSNRDLTKNLGENVKEGTEGLLLGGGLGLAGKGLSKLLPNASTWENAAKNKGLQSTGIGQKFLSEMKPEEYEASKDFVTKNNLIGVDKEEVLKKALQTQKELGQKIGSVGEELNKAGIKASEDEILGVADTLQKKAAETANLENPDLRKLSIWHNKGANDILNKIGDDPSWDSIQKLKEAYGKAAFSDTGEVKNEASKNVYFALRDMLKNLTQKAQENPNLPEEYKTALAGYHTIDPVIDGLQKAVGAERAGTGGHAGGHGFLPRLIRSLPGQHIPAVNLATAVGATMVSPHLGPLMALPTLTNPAIQSKAFSGMANAARAIPAGSGQAMTQALNDYLISKYQKKK